MSGGSNYPSTGTDGGSVYDGSDDPNGSTFSMQKSIDQNSSGSGKMQEKH